MVTPPVPSEEIDTFISLDSWSCSWLRLLVRPEVSPPDTPMRAMSTSVWAIWPSRVLTVATSVVACWLIWSRRPERLFDRLLALVRKSLTELSTSVRLRLEDGVSDADDKAE